MTRFGTTSLGCACGCGVLVVAALLLPCALEGPPSQEFDLAYPFEKAETHGRDELFVQVASGVSLSEVCDLSLFDGFEPAMTLSQAVEEHGEPDSHNKERNGLDDVSSYQTSRATIDIVRQTVFDSEGDEAGERWLLRARPTDPLAEAYPIDPIVAATPPDLYRGTMFVHLTAEDGGVTVLV